MEKMLLLQHKHTMGHGAAGTGHSLNPLNKIPTPRGLLEVGIWPGRTTGLNLRSKYGRYKGNQDLYHRDVAAKRSYYNEVAPDRAAETSSKSAMVEKRTCVVNRAPENLKLAGN